MDPMKEALLRAQQAWNRGDLDSYLELYHPEIRLHGYGPTPMGKAEVRSFYAAFFESFPGVRLEFDEMITEGATLMLRFHCDVEHKGTFMGVAPTGKRARIDGHTSMRFDGGQVRERWSTADFLTLLVQLGALPPPG